MKLIRAIVALLLTGFLAGACIGPTVAPMPTTDADTGDQFSQSSFPCQEDEALMFAPQFGPDNVGCVNVDDVVAQGNVQNVGASGDTVADVNAATSLLADLPCENMDVYLVTVGVNVTTDAETGQGYVTVTCLID